VVQERDVAKPHVEDPEKIFEEAVIAGNPL
jgi:hypothetical protein